jgi:hypothetical protein
MASTSHRQGREECGSISLVEGARYCSRDPGDKGRQMLGIEPCVLGTGAVETEISTDATSRHKSAVVKDPGGAKQMCKVLMLRLPPFCYCCHAFRPPGLPSKGHLGKLESSIT